MAEGARDDAAAGVASGRRNGASTDASIDGRLRDGVDEDAPGGAGRTAFAFDAPAVTALAGGSPDTSS